MLYQTALVVDDSKLARITLKKKIEAQGLAVTVLESGVEALQQLDDIAPDIIFMDHLMPEMDGFETTRKIREHAKWQQLAIVMCTGKEHDSYLQEAKAIGADAVLAKPPNDDALQSILQTTFERELDDVSPEFENIEQTLDALGVPEVDLSFDWPEADDVDSFEQDLAQFSELSDEKVSSEPTFDNAFDVDVGEQATAVSEVAAVEADAKPMAGDDSIAIQAMVDASVEKAVEKVNHYWQEQLKSILQNRQSETSPSLDSDAILAAVHEAVAQEKVNIIADVVATLEQPDSAVDEAALQQTVAQQVQQAVTPVSEAVSKLEQQSLQLPNEADVKLWLEQALAGQHAQAEKAVSEQDEALLAKFEQRVQKLESLMAEQLAANAAACEGLVKEALSYVDEYLAKPNGEEGETHEKLQDLQAQQAKLAEEVSLPKTLASVAISLGLCALALSVYMFIG